MQAIECEITPLSAAEVERLQAVAVRIDLDFSHALQWLATLPEWERQADLADLETVADACERGELVLPPATAARPAQAETDAVAATRAGITSAAAALDPAEADYYARASALCERGDLVFADFVDYAARLCDEARAEAMEELELIVNDLQPGEAAYSADEAVVITRLLVRKRVDALKAWQQSGLPAPSGTRL
ncbi:hypothetical protein JCM19000A_21620 [Silvimonas sp. JCM 19000]